MQGERQDVTRTPRDQRQSHRRRWRGAVLLLGAALLLLVAAALLALPRPTLRLDGSHVQSPRPAPRAPAMSRGDEPGVGRPPPAPGRVGGNTWETKADKDTIDDWKKK